jgi:hypothetical protein
MHPAVRAIGKILRLVGISSPEDSEAKPDVVGGPPSWRNPAPPKVAEKPGDGVKPGQKPGKR